MKRYTQELNIDSCLMGENEHGGWVKYEDVKELEKQNEGLIEIHIRNYKDMDNIDKVCKIAGVHPFSLMREDLKIILEKHLNKPIEEIIK